MPEVSVGLPVYNGQEFVGEAIESVLNQTFTDLELIISDNASEDETRGIIESYWRQDKRIRYVRQDGNIGAHYNYNFVFSEAGGRYFKWIAHDDVILADFIASCVKILRARSDVVLAYPRVNVIDADGEILRAKSNSYLLDIPSPVERFRRYMGDKNRSEPIFGVHRSSILRKTPLLGHYPGSDWVLLAELILRGPFVEIPEPLFLNREHAGRFSRTPTKSWGDWFLPGARRPIAPRTDQLVGYWKAISRSELQPAQKARLFAHISKWAAIRGSELARELIPLLIWQGRRLRSWRM